MKQLINDIKKNGINHQHITKLVDIHDAKRKQMVYLYERYKANIDAMPVYDRSSWSSLKVNEFETATNIRRIDDVINNELHNAFDSEIIDTRVGYLHGVPITYEIDNNDKLKEFLTNFNLRNTIDDLDSELGKMAAICGYGARLAYIDLNGDIRLRNIDPYNVVFLGDDMTEPEYSLYYYVQTDYATGEDTIHAEFYDNTYYHLFEGNSVEAFRFVEKKPHLFDYNPLFGVPNNKELQGDVEKVVNLIDAYDKTMSDASSEISQTRLAYLVLRGMGMDEDSIQQTQRSGAFELWDKDMDVKYLTKDVNNTMIEDHLDRLEKNIMRFSKSVNFNSDEFNGQVPVIGMRLKLMALENKCMTFERKMSASIRYQFKVILSALKRKGYNVTDDTYLDVYFKWGRNIPVNRLEEAQILATLNGQVSDQTRYENSPLVDDAEWEIQQRDIEALSLGGDLDEQR